MKIFQHKANSLIFILLFCVFFLSLMLRVCINMHRQIFCEKYANTPTIIIDPGHGGEDGGASTKNGILEKDINLSISKTLREMLLDSGFDVKMTRETDTSIHSPSADTIRQKKISDLHNRLKLINSEENCILISVHQNKFEDSKYFGAQVFFSGNEPRSEDLAMSIKESFKGLIQPENKREIKKAGKNIYLLTNAKIPSVIVECGFMSNEREASMLSTEEYRDKVAFAIYWGILNYYINL